MIPISVGHNQEAQRRFAPTSLIAIRRTVIGFRGERVIDFERIRKFRADGEICTAFDQQVRYWQAVACMPMINLNG